MILWIMGNWYMIVSGPFLSSNPRTNITQILLLFALLGSVSTFTVKISNIFFVKEEKWHNQAYLKVKINSKSIILF